MNLVKLESKFVDLGKRFIDKTKIVVERDGSLTFDNNFNLPKTLTDLRWYQEEFQRQLLYSDKRFFYLAWPRRAGKEVTTWTAFLKYAFLNKCTAAFIYPNQKMASRVLWDGDFSCKGSVRKFMDFLPPCIDRSRDINNTVKRIRLPNGSTIWVLGTCNPEALRGINPKLVCLSEFAFGDPLAYEAVRPILAENGGKLILQTTFNGKNFGYQMFEKVKQLSQWYTSFFTAETLVDREGRRYISEEELNIMRAEGYPEFKIRQEFYMDTSGDESLFYFADVMKHLRETNRICEGLAKPFFPIKLFWDIGESATGDSNFIIYVQFVNNQPNIVGCHQTRGKTLQAELKIVDEWCLKRQLTYDKNFLPHDGKNSKKCLSLAEDPEKVGNYVDEVRRLSGKECEAVPKPISFTYGINVIRSVLPFCKIDASCTEFIECLDNYSKKYDETRQLYKIESTHKYSNGVKALQTMCLAISEDMISQDEFKPSGWMQPF